MVAYALTHLTRRSIAWVVLLAVGVLVGNSGNAVAQTKSVATNMRGFGVPFRVNADDDSFLEVQLYVSRDLGKTWQFYSRQSTDVEEFPFFADQDGAYWFALRTLNRDRRLVPDGDIVTPELEIIVDTKKPKLDLRIETDAAGRVALRWKATDANIRPDTLQILYQASPADQVNESAWQTVDVKLADAKIPVSGIYADQIAWWPDPNVREITVRLKIEDAAGNSVQQDRHVILPLVAWRTRSNSTARPPGREISSTPVPLSLKGSLPQTPLKKLQSGSQAKADHPPGVVCENGVCRLVKSTGAPTVPSAPAVSDQANVAQFAASGQDLYGVAVPRLRPPSSVSPAATNRNRVARQTPVLPNAQRRLPVRTAQSSHPQARSPMLNLIGSDVQAVPPPVPDGYVHMAAKPAALKTPQQGGAVVWQSETERWAPKNQSAFGTTLKPDPSLVPSQPPRSSKRPQVQANPSINFQQDDQQVAQSSTNFPSNQYQGIVPTVSSEAFKNRPPQLLPNANSNNQIATSGRRLLSKPPTDPNSLGPLRNYEKGPSDNAGRSMHQPSSFARQRQRANVKAMPVSAPLSPTRSAVPASIGSNSGNAALQMISTKRFRLDYAINAIDPSGVAKVDLWMTRDNGRNWKVWGSDPDNVSPFPVQVNDEGRYGFRVVIHSRDGLTGQGPSTGDQPDIYIHVDSQPPLVKITSVPYGRNSEAGRLIINWRASDPFLSLRPIRLSYSRGPTGPWTVIEDGLRNVSRYVWKVEPNVPERIFLKIEATDQAGNVGVHQLSQSIDISGLVPRGTIRGVVPVGQ